MERSKSEDGYLSDDSDFYGSAETKATLVARTSAYDPVQWWKQTRPTLTQLAASNMSTHAARDSTTLYNPYAHMNSARRLSETVPEFLARLPPDRTQVVSNFPWIIIANPYIPCRTPGAGEGTGSTGDKEMMPNAPPEDESEWGKFCVLGRKILDELSISRKILENKMKGRDVGSIARAVNRERDRVVDQLMAHAKDLHCTTGKWMLFISNNTVNAVWSVVAKATANNELGVAAKVAPYDPLSDQRSPRLICIYTKDFTDMEDITRVVSKMRDLGLVEMKGRPIYYKCNAYTHLEINSNNEYNIKASLFSSAEILKPKIKKIETLFKPKSV